MYYQVDVHQLKAITAQIRILRTKKIDVCLLKSTLIGKVISTLQEKLQKFRAKIQSKQIAVVMTKEEDTLLQACSAETSQLLKELKEMYHQQSTAKANDNKSTRDHSLPKNSPNKTKDGQGQKGNQGKQIECNERQKKCQNNEGKPVGDPKVVSGQQESSMVISQAIQLDEALVERYKEKHFSGDNAQVPPISYRKSMLLKFYEILSKAEIYDDMLVSILGVKYSPIPG